MKRIMALGLFGLIASTGATLAQEAPSLDIAGMQTAQAGSGNFVVYFGLDQATITPLMGIMNGLKAFVAAVLGGIGNVPGAMVGGLAIGISEQLVAGYVSTDYRDAITFGILIVMLLLRPQGLLGTTRTEKV